MIPIYKEKGDARLWGKYRRVKLLEHNMKVIKIMLEKRLRKVVKLDERQMGFIPGKGTIETIVIIRQMIEKYEAAGRKLFMVL